MFNTFSVNIVFCISFNCKMIQCIEVNIPSSWHQHSWDTDSVCGWLQRSACPRSPGSAGSQPSLTSSPEPCSPTACVRTRQRWKKTLHLKIHITHQGNARLCQIVKSHTHTHTLTVSWHSETASAEGGLLLPSASPRPTPRWLTRAGRNSASGGPPSWPEPPRAGWHQAPSPHLAPAQCVGPVCRQSGYDSSGSHSRHFVHTLRSPSQAAAPPSVEGTSDWGSRAQRWTWGAACPGAPRRRRSDGMSPN